MPQDDWSKAKQAHIHLLDVLQPPEKMAVFLNRVHQHDGETSSCMEAYLAIVKEEFGMIATINARFFFNRAKLPGTKVSK